MFLLARAEASGLPLVRERLYLDETVADVARTLKVIADARDIEIDINGTADATISGDQLLLRQLITNLLDNAIRHARRRVSIGISVVNNQVCISVSDDGPGIASGDRERIFRRFVRLDPESGGGGLGLPIARWIAEAHSGSLTLEGSTGAVFRFAMPLN
jgi:signal transduction histidine kinase